MQVNESTDSQLMVIAAFRYCLGRQSYIVRACLDWLRANWGSFTQNTKLIILRDTIEALMDERAGSPTIGVPGWRAFAEWAWERSDGDDHRWVFQATAHKRKPWPLNTETEAAS